MEVRILAELGKAGSSHLILDVVFRNLHGICKLPGPGGVLIEMALQYWAIY
jgi:hypothetical protein